jgi:hypothetical protein
MSTDASAAVPKPSAFRWAQQDFLCVSACAYAFLGGITRDFDKNSIYGIHRFGSDRPISGDDAQVLTTVIAKYIQQMGVDMSVLQAASFAPYDGDVFIVPVEAAKSMRIIYDPSGAASFVIEQHGTKTVALFQAMKAEIPYRGELACEASRRIMRIYDSEGIVPSLLKQAKHYLIEAEANGKKLSGFATYERTNPPAMIFDIPEMDENSFAEPGFALTLIF